MESALMPVEQEILETITTISMDLYESGAIDSEWTPAIKGKLCDLAKQKGLHPWTTHPHGEWGEWLWDVAWVRHGIDHAGANGKIQPGWMDFHGVFLAGEIEWGRNSHFRLEDFLKLTVAVAEYRLFVCTIPQRRIDCWFEIVRDIEQACPASCGFRYFVIGIHYCPVISRTVTTG